MPVCSSGPLVAGCTTMGTWGRFGVSRRSPMSQSHTPTKVKALGAGFHEAKTRSVRAPGPRGARPRRVRRGPVDRSRSESDAKLSGESLAELFQGVPWTVIGWIPKNASQGVSLKGNTGSTGQDY